MYLKHLAECSITIRRFDTGEDVTFEHDKVLEVDEQTGAHLKGMKTTDEFGKGIRLFIEVSDQGELIPEDDDELPLDPEFSE